MFCLVCETEWCVDVVSVIIRDGVLLEPLKKVYIGYVTNYLQIIKKRNITFYLIKRCRRVVKGVFVVPFLCIWSGVGGVTASPA